MQLFIAVTSGIVTFSMARYILRHSDNVYLETYLYLLTFTYFMYMNIIAQASAVAVIMLGTDALEKGRYFRFIAAVFLASCLHSSALICLCFVPLYRLRQTRKNQYRFVGLTILLSAGADQILPAAVRLVFPQFAYYLQMEDTGGFDKVRLMHLSFYILCLVMGTILHRRYALREESRALPRHFLFYVSVLAVIMRLFVYKMYIFSRMGYYFYPFSCSFLVQAVHGIPGSRIRLQVSALLCGGMILFFLILINSLQSAYGVVPYEFFWE